MKIKEGLLGFSSNKYREKISSPDYSYAELATNIYKKRRSIVSSKTSAVTGVATAHVSGGTSLIGSAWAGRNISVEKQKLELLEEEWERRGQDPLPKRKLTDVIIPILITGAMGVFAFNVDLGIANATHTAATAAAMGVPGYDFNGHAVGAYYDVVEKGMKMGGNRVANSLP